MRFEISQAGQHHNSNAHSQGHCLKNNRFEFIPSLHPIFYKSVPAAYRHYLYAYVSVL